MRVDDYYTVRRRSWFRLHEKGGKRHEVPAHQYAEPYIDAYLGAAGIADEKKEPRFRNDPWPKRRAHEKSVGPP